MKFRPSLFGIACGLVLCAGSAFAAPQIEGRQVSVQAGDVQQYLSGHFPQTHDALGGLLALTVSDPQLRLPPGNRLNLGFDLAVATAGGAPSPVGHVSLSSGLRYDNARQGFFLDQPAIEDFQPVHAGARLDAGTRELLNAWLVDYARKQPIYRIEPSIASLMGTLQVESASVRDGRLVVEFNQDVSQLLPAGALQQQ
ncbi:MULTISPECIES: DUF1439 domain-containing protein [Gammaproteobacteria]|uniref:DUF1439 domain-containing protein n=1 Tax=Gammaproteobacteria TaxID=1236 RepID=UPI00112690D6|nr:DUF1439 domain-containing protein [Pseudomonas sp. Hp2]